MDTEQRIQAKQDIRNSISRAAKRMIWVTFTKPGYHYYPQAQIDPALEDVSYLGNKHRHLFKFKVQIEIFHNDRELEFHQVLNFCESLFSGQLDIDSKSVEMLSDDLYEALATKYPERDMIINVSEDGECGAEIHYNKNCRK